MDLIRFLIASAGITGVFIYLGKIFIEKIAEAGLKKYEHELRMKSDLEFEKFKHELQLENSKKQLQISKIHENQALIIDKSIVFFNTIAEIIKSIEKDIFNAEFVVNQSKRALKEYTLFENYFNSKKHYLPSSKSYLIIQVMTRFPIHFSQALKLSEINLNSKGEIDVNQALIERKELNDMLSEILEMLTQMFREMVGVE